MSIQELENHLKYSSSKYKFTCIVIRRNLLDSYISDQKANKSINGDILTRLISKSNSKKKIFFNI